MDKIVEGFEIAGVLDENFGKRKDDCYGHRPLNRVGL